MIETRVEILEKIEKDIATSRDYPSWSLMIQHYYTNKLVFMLVVVMEDRMQRYAQAMCQLQIQACSEQTDGFQRPLVLKTKNVAE